MAVRQDGAWIRLAPFPFLDWCFTTRTKKCCSVFNQKCTEKQKTCVNTQIVNGTQLVLSSASMFAPKVEDYRGEDYSCAPLWCWRLSSAVRSSVYVPTHKYQEVYVNVLFLCVFCVFCLYPLSIWVLQQILAQLNWDICCRLWCEKIRIHLTCLSWTLFSWWSLKIWWKQLVFLNYH